MMSANLPQKTSVNNAKYFQTSEQPGCWRLRGPDVPVVAFSTRTGGVSDGVYDSLNLGLSSDDNPDRVRVNRERLCAHVGVDAVATIGQVHGATVIEAQQPGLSAPGDVLVTTDPDLALAVTTADCLGVVLWDHRRTVVAVAHAGWRGVLAGAIENALQSIRSHSPNGIYRAVIGPGIRQCCFEVGEEVARRFPTDAVRAASPRPYLDLARVVRRRLLAGGIAADSILDASACTCCSRDLFFSHRRDRGRTGRHWTLARLRPSGRSPQP